MGTNGSVSDGGVIEYADTDDGFTLTSDFLKPIEKHELSTVHRIYNYILLYARRVVCWYNDIALQRFSFAKYFGIEKSFPVILIGIFA